jgi:hypothetical protein
MKLIQGGGYDTRQGEELPHAPRTRRLPEARQVSEHAQTPAT